MNNPLDSTNSAASAADAIVMFAKAGHFDDRPSAAEARSNEMWIGYESALPFGLYESIGSALDLMS